jgi:hypothetical protein
MRQVQDYLRVSSTLALLTAVVLPLAGACTSAGRQATSSAMPAPSSARPAGHAGWKLSWGHAVRIPGIDAASSLACLSAGNCLAGGSTSGGARVVSERNGRWGKATALPGRRTEGIASVSCASAGNCAAGGTYTDGHGMYQVFVVSERNGRWGVAVQVPGTANLDARHHPALSSVSCPAAGFCEAGGYYTVAGDSHAFVAAVGASGHKRPGRSGWLSPACRPVPGPCRGSPAGRRS